MEFLWIVVKNLLYSLNIFTPGYLGNSTQIDYAPL